MIKRFAVAASAALALVAVGALPAAAHVTVSPERMARGTSDVILTFRVPNESATAATTGLKVQFPLAHPIIVVNPEAGSGWHVDVVRTTLAKPVTTDDGTFTSVTSEVDWSGGSIPVGQFGEFNVLAQGIPSQASELVFKAIQTYGDGTVVSWIEVPSKAVPDPAYPAPTIILTAAGTPGGVGAPTTTTAAAGGAAVAGSGSGDALAVTALILAGAAVLLGLLAVWLGRPRLGDSGSDPAAP